eukprot:356625-Chlamydomonas_euryale.AAC.6
MRDPQVTAEQQALATCVCGEGSGSQPQYHRRLHREAPDGTEATRLGLSADGWEVWQGRALSYAARLSHPPPASGLQGATFRSKKVWRVEAPVSQSMGREAYGGPSRAPRAAYTAVAGYRSESMARYLADSPEPPTQLSPAPRHA